jgi:hypothetical protein
MAIARVVTFEGVDRARIDGLKSRIEEGDRPEGLDASELIVLHDPDGKRSLTLVFFDSEDAYRRGDEILDAMPTGDTPGQRRSVERYDVAIRMKP